MPTPDLKPPPAIVQTETREADLRGRLPSPDSFGSLNAPRPAELIFPVKLSEEFTPRISLNDAVHQLLTRDAHELRSSEPAVRSAVGPMNNLNKAIAPDTPRAEADALFKGVLDAWRRDPEKLPWIRSADHDHIRVGGADGPGTYEAAARLIGMREIYASKVRAGFSPGAPDLLPNDELFGKYSPILDAQGYYEKVIAAHASLGLRVDAATGYALLNHKSDGPPLGVSVRDVAVEAAGERLAEMKSGETVRAGVDASPSLRARIDSITAETAKNGEYAPVDRETGSIKWPLMRKGDTYTLEPRAIIDPALPIAGVEVTYTVPSGPPMERSSSRHVAASSQRLDTHVFTGDGNGWHHQCFASTERPDGYVTKLPTYREIAGAGNSSPRP